MSIYDVNCQTDWSYYIRRSRLRTTWPKRGGGNVTRWPPEMKYIFIASYYRQLSADIKMKNYTIKTGINFMIFILIFIENDFSVWLRTGSKPADINRYQSHTGKYITYIFVNP